MTVKLFIVRHGNTFEAGEIPVRVGCRTDMHLSTSGREQAESLGQFFKQQQLQFDAVYSSQLRRCYQTAKIMLESMALSLDIHQMSQFNEIDYDVDEGKTDSQVIARIGKHALDQWSKLAIPPPGWRVDREKIIQGWLNFSDDILKRYESGAGAVVVVTSNGIARFAPYILEDVELFKKNYPLKVATGSVSCFIFGDENKWQLESWNVRPE